MQRLQTSPESTVESEGGSSGPLPESRLGLLDGIGAIFLDGDEGEETLTGRGTWRPLATGPGYEELRELIAPGVALPFVGQVFRKGGDPWDHESRPLEVEVTSVERCPPEDDQGGCLVRLELRRRRD